MSVRHGSLGARVTTTVDMKLEVVVIPVTDVDRAKIFYEGSGWRLDADKNSGENFRLVQFTPKGSDCSIQFGSNLTPAAPGSAQGLHLIVSDIEAAHEELVAHGVDVSEPFHCQIGYACRFADNDQPLPGPAPERASYGSFLSFNDPNGNSWILQEVTTRFRGRVVGQTTYASADDLAQAIRRAAVAHGQQQADTDAKGAIRARLVRRVHGARELSGERHPS
jgi:catechol 2,3-dioxygenase-like lactoylglutathione lyase family enzyme